MTAPAPIIPISSAANLTLPAEPHNVDATWDSLQLLEINPSALNRNRLISATRGHPAHVTIDMLRTRILHAIKENGWKNIGITAPTTGCGTSFIACNLAVSLSRGESRRVILMDMNLRHPGVHEMFGTNAAFRMGNFLTRHIEVEDYFCRVGENLALGLNNTVEAEPAEYFLDDTTSEILLEMQNLMAPDIVIYDLPPALAHDDVVAFLPQLDAVLLVVGGGITTAEHVHKTERLLGDSTPLLGTVLNMAEGPTG
jgi:protein-tyrosine kinase